MVMWRVVCIAAFFTSVSVMTQQLPEAELHRRFDAALMRTDAGWREESSRLRKGARLYSLKVWVRDKVSLNMFHYPHQTADEAAQTTRELTQGSSVGFRAIKGYGDEAYLIDSPSSLETRLIVRRGTTVLSIGSLDGNAVMKVGELFVREIEQARREGLVR